MARTLLLCLFALIVSCRSSSGGHARGKIAIVGATIYTAPGIAPLQNGVIVIDGDAIAAVGPESDVLVPSSAKIIDGHGTFVTAGFWNSHAHLTDERFVSTRDTTALNAAFRDMFARYGVTTVVDLGSSIENSVLLRTRRDIAAPTIFTAGPTLWVSGGVPFYMKPIFEELKVDPPTASTPEEAAAMAEWALGHGADLIKIFTGSPVGEGKTVNMPLEMVRAVVKTAHDAGKLVAAHPQDLEGVRVAVDGGVDILAHTAPNAVLPDDLVHAMADKHVGVIPTITLWHQGLIQEGETSDFALAHQTKGVAQLHQLVDGKVDILFGTDVGYMRYSDTQEEYAKMSEAGMSFDAILASMTTAPAKRFGVAKHVGVLSEAMRADVVVLNRDPAKDVSAFADVRATISRGRIIYDATAP